MSRVAGQGDAAVAVLAPNVIGSATSAAAIAPSGVGAPIPPSTRLLGDAEAGAAGQDRHLRRACGPVTPRHSICVKSPSYGRTSVETRTLVPRCLPRAARNELGAATDTCLDDTKDCRPKPAQS